MRSALAPMRARSAMRSRGLVSGYLFRATFDPTSANGEALRRAFHLLVAEQLLPLDASDGESK